MFTRASFIHVCLAIAIVAVFGASAMAQVEPSAAGGEPAPENDTRMLTPSLLSGSPYSATAGADLRKNVFKTGLTVTGAWLDNVFPGESTSSAGQPPVADETVSFFPSFSYLRATPRQEATVDYSPGFTYYVPTSGLNSNTSGLDSFNQSATGGFDGRLTQHVSLDLQDNFIRTSNIFDSSYPFSSGSLTGSTQTPTPAAIVPFAEQVRNFANAVLSYQYARDAMVGGGATFSESRYPNPSQAAGLYNSDAEGGAAFYSRRVSRRQYLGVRYEYDRIVGGNSTIQVESQTQTFLPFYSVFFSRTISLSAAAGATRTAVSQAQQPTTSSWSASTVLSLAWQGEKGSVSSSFLRTVSSGPGLIGAFNSVSANLNAGWKLSRFWNASASFNYQNIEPVSPLANVIIYQGGNSLMAQGTVGRSWGEHLAMQWGYQRLHEEFTEINAINANPNTDRAFMSLTCNFEKPLGK